MRKELGKNIRFSTKKKLIIRQCHACNNLTESTVEQQKCMCCDKAFLPTDYFAKIHEHTNRQFDELFAESHEIDEDKLVKGIHVIW